MTIQHLKMKIRTCIDRDSFTKKQQKGDNSLYRPGSTMRASNAIPQIANPSKVISSQKFSNSAYEAEFLLLSRAICSPCLFMDFLLSFTLSCPSLPSSSFAFFTIRTRGTDSEFIDSRAIATSISAASLASAVLPFLTGVAGGSGIAHLLWAAS